jgi:hypothetical protein
MFQDVIYHCQNLIELCLMLLFHTFLEFDIFQAHLPVTGDLFPPVIGLLRQAQIDPDELRLQYSDRPKQAPRDVSEKMNRVPAAAR